MGFLAWGDERLKQAALRLCGMTFRLRREYCRYQRSPAYKQDWEIVRNWHRRKIENERGPERVKHAIRRLLRQGFATREEYETYWASDVRIRDCALVRAWEEVVRGAQTGQATTDAA